MSDFMPPSGPPPSKAPVVPEGWKAQWNDQYKEWFYVNIYTKKSQWDKPTEPIYPPPGDDAPPGPPPGYAGGGVTASDTKQNPYDPQPNTESDAELARRLQAEEDERARGFGGSSSAMNDYANTPVPQSQSPYGSQELPPREQKRGFLGKLLGKTGGGGSSSGGYRPQQGYGGGGYGSPPPQQYGGYPQKATHSKVILHKATNKVTALALDMVAVVDMAEVDMVEVEVDMEAATNNLRRSQEVLVLEEPRLWVWVVV